MTIDASVSIANIFQCSSVLSEANMRILVVLLEIVIGLALVGTVATSTSTGSTALAAFTSAQALVIIIPLIFVAIILYAAVRHVQGQGRQPERVLSAKHWTLNHRGRRCSRREHLLVWNRPSRIRYGQPGKQVHSNRPVQLGPEQRSKHGNLHGNSRGERL